MSLRLCRLTTGATHDTRSSALLVLLGLAGLFACDFWPLSEALCFALGGFAAFALLAFGPSPWSAGSPCAGPRRPSWRQVRGLRSARRVWPARSERAAWRRSMSQGRRTGPLRRRTPRPGTPRGGQQPGRSSSRSSSSTHRATSARVVATCPTQIRRPPTNQGPAVAANRPAEGGQPRLRGGFRGAGTWMGRPARPPMTTVMAVGTEPLDPTTETRRISLRGQRATGPDAGAGAEDKGVTVVVRRDRPHVGQHRESRDTGSSAGGGSTTSSPPSTTAPGCGCCGSTRPRIRRPRSSSSTRSLPGCRSGSR